MDVLTKEQLQRLLKTRKLGRPHLEVWDSIDSTNNRAAELATAGAEEGTFIAARQQTSGRGRLGRSWTSPMDAGLYATIILRPTNLLPADIAPITLAFGVAAARAIEAIAGVQIHLKWVNDLICEGKKVGGILAEMPSGTSMMTRPLIVGFGLNMRINPSVIPEELVEKADWLERISRLPINPNQLAAELLLELESVYECVNSKRTEAVLSEWKNRSATLGRQIIATSGPVEIRGCATDIDNNGALIVRTEDGQIKQIHAGEVTIRAADGKYI